MGDFPVFLWRRASASLTFFPLFATGTRLAPQYIEGGGVDDAADGSQFGGRRGSHHHRK